MAGEGQEKPDFGMKMKRLREERGVSLRQIADVTRISVSMLEALERNDILRLPGGIYSRAFVRSYAIEVGLDPEQTVHDFLSQFPHDSLIAGSPNATELRRVPGIQRTGSQVRVFVVLAVIGAVVLLALFLLQ
jgi:cytoskeleton protein RodZ